MWGRRSGDVASEAPPDAKRARTDASATGASFDIAAIRAQIAANLLPPLPLLHPLLPLKHQISPPSEHRLPPRRRRLKPGLLPHLLLPIRHDRPGPLPYRHLRPWTLPLQNGSQAQKQRLKL